MPHLVKRLSDSEDTNKEAVVVLKVKEDTVKITGRRRSPAEHPLGGFPRFESPRGPEHQAGQAVSA